MIQQAYNKWDRTPVIVTLSEVPTPVWDLTFPAVTICPEIKVSKERFNFTTNFNALFRDWYRDKNNSKFATNVTNENIGKVKAIIHHCSGIYKNSKNFIFKLNHIPEPSLVEFLKNVSLDRRNVLTLCGSTSDNKCTNYMQVSLTDEGVCYSFNMVSQDEIFRADVLHGEYKHLERWDEDGKGTEADVPVEQVRPTKLLRVAGSGLDAAIGFNMVHYPLKIDTSCVRGRGYKVLLHESNAYPDLAKRHIRLPVSHSLTIAVKPNIMLTSPELTKYSAIKRQCYFEHERPLRYFRRYNQDNCELECLTNYTEKECGCVHFSMPHTNETRVCTLPEAHCPSNARAHLFIRKQTKNTTEDYLQLCDCLPSCTSVRYDLQITQNANDEEKDFRSSLLSEEELQANLLIPVYSVLQIYFQDTHFIPAQRSELHGLVDFLANCGGLLGLFIGVSLLSIVELVYYVAVRPMSCRDQKS
ncbi:AGAP010967-PA-like protein [Anopheles sinensis]|uniref:AGAP010967-PA-like protein n=1 Tax=Anopheles sinensis TaxID=74873 RepID=A0A084WQY3_ANOSI|nr:AGAP010967-PA-like protein [Anopheles sinensis]